MRRFYCIIIKNSIKIIKERNRKDRVWSVIYWTTRIKHSSTHMPTTTIDRPNIPRESLIFTLYFIIKNPSYHIIHTPIHTSTINTKIPKKLKKINPKPHHKSNSASRTPNFPPFSKLLNIFFKTWYSFYLSSADLANS